MRVYDHRGRKADCELACEVEIAVKSECRKCNYCEPIELHVHDDGIRVACPHGHVFPDRGPHSEEWGFFPWDVALPLGIVPVDWGRLAVALGVADKETKQ